jgi:hypothetical protein
MVTYYQRMSACTGALHHTSGGRSGGGFVFHGVDGDGLSAMGAL